METKKIGLGDLFQLLLKHVDLTILDEELLASLNETKLSSTKGLDLLYRVGHKPNIVIPKVNAEEILQEVNKKEELFVKFWNLYDKKAGTKDARNKFLKLSMADIEKIMQILPAYLSSTPDVKFRKLPVTFLNQRTWEDDIYSIKTSQVKTINAFKF